MSASAYLVLLENGLDFPIRKSLNDEFEFSEASSEFFFFFARS